MGGRLAHCVAHHASGTPWILGVGPKTKVFALHLAVSGKEGAQRDSSSGLDAGVGGYGPAGRTPKAPCLRYGAGGRLGVRA